MKILPDLMSIYVLPVRVSVIQVIMFIRARHKWKENVCKLKLHIMIFFFFFYSENILGLFIALWLFWSKQLFP